MGLTGDYHTLGKWESSFGALAKSGFLRHMSQVLADESLRLVDAGFAGQRNPYGEPWAPKKQPNGKPILIGKTRKLSKYRRQRVSSSGFTIGTKAPHAVFHQWGTATYRGRPKYPITAEAGKMLRFRVGGKWVYRRSVDHPGVPQRMIVPNPRVGLPRHWSAAFRRQYVAQVERTLH